MVKRKLLTLSENGQKNTWKLVTFSEHCEKSTLILVTFGVLCELSKSKLETYGVLGELSKSKLVTYSEHDELSMYTETELSVSSYSTRNQNTHLIFQFDISKANFQMGKMVQNGEKIVNDVYGESSFQIVKFHHWKPPIR